MFVLDVTPVTYRNPWESSFDLRKRKLGTGCINLVYLYEAPDTSTFRYRVYNMIQAIETTDSDLNAVYFTYDEIDGLRGMAEKVDILVLCRCRYTHKLNELVSILKRRGAQVVFDVDDLVFNPSYVNLIVDTLDQDLAHPGVWDHWFAYTARIGEALRLCDYAVTTNEFLGARITEYSGLDAAVVPNFLNREQIQISDKLFQQKKNSEFMRNELFHIGYFSGTPSHNKDFRIIEPALINLLKEFSNLRILVVGYLNPSTTFGQFSDRVQSFPLHDFVNLQRIISLVEVNVVPLQDNIFTNCKSELKFFEAAMVGTVTLASPTFCYRRAIDDALNGFLVNSYEWEERISQTMKGMERYQDIVDAARQYASTNYAPEGQVAAIRGALRLPASREIGRARVS